MDVNNLLTTYNFLNNQFNTEDRNLFVIKSNLMHKCLLWAEEANFNIDTRSVCCKWCLNALSPWACDVTLEPQKHPKKHLRTLLKKDTNSQNSFQKKFLEKIRNKPISNTMIFKCHFCLRTTLIPLKKPVVDSKSKSEVNVVEEKGKKRKKKKKELYAGLNVAAVQSVKNIPVNVNPNQSPKVKTPIKNHAKKLSMKEQLRMQKVLLQPAVTKKKPSLLATFLDNM